MPLMITAAGGFMLVGPALLAGYFRLARVLREGGVPGWRDLLAGFREAPRQLWGLALVCALLLMIWLTDAGILYSFMIGATAIAAGSGAMGRFLGWSVNFHSQFRRHFGHCLNNVPCNAADSAVVFRDRLPK